MLGPADGAGDQKMASERDPCIVHALTTLAGVLSPLARAVSNSMEGTRGTSSSNLSPAALYFLSSVRSKHQQHREVSLRADLCIVNTQ